MQSETGFARICAGMDVSNTQASPMNVEVAERTALALPTPTRSLGQELCPWQGPPVRIIASARTARSMLRCGSISLAIRGMRPNTRGANLIRMLMLMCLLPVANDREQAGISGLTDRPVRSSHSPMKLAAIGCECQQRNAGDGVANV